MKRLLGSDQGLCSHRVRGPSRTQCQRQRVRGLTEMLRCQQFVLNVTAVDPDCQPRSV